MAKYLDSNGLSHFMTLIKSLFSVKTHTHPIGKSTGASVTVTAGTAASLSTETKTFVTDASKVTLGTPSSITPVTKKTVVTGGSKTSIPNISKKTVVTGVTKKTVVTGHTPMSAVCSQGLLTLTADSVTTGDSVTVTTGDSVTVGTAIEAYTSLTTGDSVTEGTAVDIPNVTVADASTDTVKGVDTFTANTPTAVTPKTVVTSVDANTGQASA